MSLEITSMQLLGLLIGTSIASGALTFILGYWYVRSKIEDQLDSVMDISMDMDLRDESLDLPGESLDDA